MIDVSVSAYRARYGSSDVHDKGGRRRRSPEQQDEDTPARSLARLQQHLVEARRLGKPEVVAKIEAAVRRVGIVAPLPRPSAARVSGEVAAGLYEIHAGGGYYLVIEGRVIASLRSRAAAEAVVSERKATGG